jgi:hypothetical protein
MLHVQKISNGEFTLKVNGKLPKLSNDLENEIEHLWISEQHRQDSALFNGRILSASIVSCNGIEGCIAEYRHLIAQTACPELFDYLRVRPVAVSGLLECADGIVFGRRAVSMTQDAGLWELVPSGGIDANKINDDPEYLTVEIDIVSQLLTELHEETGIKSDSISGIYPFCLVDDTDSHVLDIGLVIKSSLSSDEILRAHRKNATKEYDRLRFIPRAEICKFIQEEASRLVGVSTVLIQHFLETSGE